MAVSLQELGQETVTSMNKNDHLSAALIAVWKKMKIVDDTGFEEVFDYVKKHQFNVITKDAKLDILILQAKLCHDHYLKQRRFSLDQNRSQSKGESTVPVVSYLMQKKEAIAEVLSDYINGIPLKWS